MNNGNLVDSFEIGYNIEKAIGKLRVLSGFMDKMQRPENTIEYELDNHAVVDHLETIVKMLSELQSELVKQRDSLIESRVKLN